MPDAASTVDASPKPPYRLSAGPGILLIVATLVVCGIGYLSWQILVVPYQQVEVTDPMPLGPVVDGCQPRIQVEYPVWLSLDDQGVQQAKRIVFTLDCDRPLTQIVPVTFEITSNPSGWIRFFDAQGEDISPNLVAEVPPGGQSRVSLYPECLNRPITPTRLLTLTLTLASASVTEPAASFTIELESYVQTFLRHVVSSALGPLSAGQLTLLGSLGAFLWHCWKTWNEKQREFSSLYEKMRKNKGDLAALRELYSRYQGLQGVFPFNIINRDPRIENLLCTVEAEERVRCVVESLEKNDFETAREWDCRLFACDRTHWAIPVLGCLVNLLADDSAPDPQKCLEQLRRGWDKAEPRLRCHMVRALSRIPLAGAHKFLREKEGDPDLGVRIEIAWAFSRVKRPPDLDERLRRLVTASLDEWLHTLGEPLEVRDPFGEAIAESAYLVAEPFIWEHPLYEQLYIPVAMAVLAPAGGGKTTARLALQRRFWGTTDAFMLEYTDFHLMIGRPSRIAARHHAAAILHCAAQAVSGLLLDDPRRLASVHGHRERRLIHSLLVNHLSDLHLARQLDVTLQEILPSPDEEWHSLLSGRLPAEAMRDLVTIVRALGFGELYLLVDRLNNMPETRDLAVAEALLCHLLNDPAFLDVPHLHLKLFLPTEWEEFVVGCGGLRSGRVYLRRLEWDEKSLSKILRERLQVTGVESLNRLAVDNIYPSDLDAALAREAHDSPRRLVELGETLLRLRALGWEEADRDPSKARLQTEDWAAMLEYGLRRAAERKVAAG